VPAILIPVSNRMLGIREIRFFLSTQEAVRRYFFEYNEKVGKKGILEQPPRSLKPHFQTIYTGSRMISEMAFSATEAN